MAAIAGLGVLPTGLKTSAIDPLCERINKVAWSSIWPFGFSIGIALGGLISWGWTFNPLITLPVTVGLALFISAAYFLFQWPLPYAIDVEYEEVLTDTITQEPLCDPWIARPCGHTADAGSAFGFINEKGKCTVACEQNLSKHDFVPNRLIIGLLNALHGKLGYAAQNAFHTFVELHRDESMVLPDGRSCNVLQAVLAMRARACQGVTWDEFCQANREDLFRSAAGVEPRVGIDMDALRAVFAKGGTLDDRLEQLYKQSTYNIRWQRVVDKYSEHKA